MARKKFDPAAYAAAHGVPFESSKDDAHPTPASAKKAKKATGKAKSKPDKKADIQPAPKGKKTPKAKAEPKATEPDVRTSPDIQPVKKAKAPKVDPATEVSNIPDSTVTLKTNTAPSVEIANQLQQAFDHFNVKLFEGKLEPVVFSNTRLKKSNGHFWAKSWTRRSELKGKVHEIGLDFARLNKDPDHGDMLVLSTLVHEMCHQLIEQIGKAPARAYHCKYWVAAMHMVGLSPVILDAKGVPTGKATGPNSSHTIDQGGRFEMAAKELLSEGFKFQWANESLDQEADKKPKAKKKAGAKAKHTCPECGANAWGKPSMVLHCYGTKGEEHAPVEMECDRDAYSEGDDEAEGNN